MSKMILKKARACSEPEEALSVNMTGYFSVTIQEGFINI